MKNACDQNGLITTTINEHLAKGLSTVTEIQKDLEEQGVTVSREVLSKRIADIVK